MENFIAIKEHRNEVAGLVDFIIGYYQQALVSYLARLASHYCTLATILARSHHRPQSQRQVNGSPWPFLLGSARGELPNDVHRLPGRPMAVGMGGGKVAGNHSYAPAQTYVGGPHLIGSPGTS